MKVPMGSFDDYDSTDAQIEYRENRWKYWAVLKKLKEEYVQEKDTAYTINVNIKEFADWVENKFGIRPTITDGQITDHYAITHEGLYSFFILKYM